MKFLNERPRLRKTLKVLGWVVVVALLTAIVCWAGYWGWRWSKDWSKSAPKKHYKTKTDKNKRATTTFQDSMAARSLNLFSRWSSSSNSSSSSSETQHKPAKKPVRKTVKKKGAPQGKKHTKNPKEKPDLMDKYPAKPRIKFNGSSKKS